MAETLLFSLGGETMFKIFKAGLTIFWIMDILNLPFMAKFDTTYALNGAFWILAWIFIGFCGEGD